MQIDTYEMKKCLESMGQKPSDQDVLELMGAIDEDGSGYINFLEFMNMVSPPGLVSLRTRVFLPAARRHFQGPL